jgi:cyclomaltodextrinase
MNNIPLGKYRHYKGKEYEVIGVAKHTETMESFIVYRALYGDFGLWVRPQSMFLETVNIEGKDVPRFEFLSPESIQAL